MEDFSEYNQNFSLELIGKDDEINLHLNTLFLELQDIYTATYIFRTVDTEWDKKVQEKDVPDYSTVRTVLYESLVYRVILGLSKIFANHKEYSLSKAVNQIEQIYKNNSEVKTAIKEIRQKFDNSPMIPKIRVFRDKFFAHLDKENVLSYFRVDPTMAMKDIDHNEIEEWLSLIGKLYKTCFGAELPRKSQMPSKDDIIYTFFWR
jgi:hypothetical protein